MPVIYVAKSKGIENWGADVGLTKHVYKVGVAAESAEAAVAALNAEGVAGHRDWKLVKKKPVETGDEAAALQRLGARVQAVDPDYYPGVKGAAGIFKVRPADIADFLIRNALA
jgi:hypothetical protein